MFGNLVWRGVSRLIEAAMFGWTPPQRLPGYDNIGGEVIADEFGTEPVTAYRSWLVANPGDGTGLALKSLHIGYMWQAGTNTADCRPVGFHQMKERHSGGISPHPDCACGIYAQKPDHAFTEWDMAKRGYVSVSGNIRMWGRIIVCARGYKAQHVDLGDPLVLETSCKAGCEKEPTRIELADRARAYPAFCDDHTPAYDEPVVTVQAEVWLREAARELAAKYDREFIYWTML